MRVSVKDEIEAGREWSRGLLWIVDDENASARPLDRAGRISEIHPQSPRLTGQSLAVVQVVISEDAEQGDGESGEAFEHGRLRDVPGVDHALDAGFLKERHDLVDVAHLIVGVTDDADSHRASLSRHALVDLDCGPESSASGRSPGSARI